ncbi:MAG: hypothetical protein QW386_03810 [Candidatus Bathyarchaeia archaeon]
MQIPDVKTWKTAVLLSIIVPISLLTSFKLTGLIAEPQTITETTTLKPVYWEFPRINGTIDVRINDVLQATHVSDELSAMLHLKITEYSPYHGGFTETLAMFTNVTLSVTNFKAFIESVRITFYEDSEPSAVDWFEQKFECSNLHILGVKESWKTPEKAFVNLSSINRSGNAYFFGVFLWNLFSSRDYTHFMEVNFEITYYNGTVFKRLVQPFQLCLRPDLQYIEVHTLTSNMRDKIFVGSIELSGVRILIDDVEYFSPASVVLPAKKHTVTFEPTTYVNSTKYVLVGLLDPNGHIAFGNTLTVEAASYSCISATYETE